MRKVQRMDLFELVTLLWWLGGLAAVLGLVIWGVLELLGVRGFRR